MTRASAIRPKITIEIDYADCTLSDTFITSMQSFISASNQGNIEDRPIYSSTLVAQVLQSLSEDAREILPTSDECFQKYGIRPISFSIPTQQIYLQSSCKKSHHLSQIVPGLPYSYQGQEEYYQQYQASNYAFSPFKGGPDALRHLEILANRCLPLIPGISELHPFNMIHYPKKALSQILKAGLYLRESPPSMIFDSFNRYISEHLSSRSMVQYMLQTSSLSDSRNVLFLDANLHTRQDYMSLLTLIGLKELFGSRCTAYASPSYLYSQKLLGSDVMYGRGFTYVGSLLGYNETKPNESRLTARGIYRALKANYFDAVVFGSITRNLQLYTYLSDVINPETTILVCGEDRPLSHDAIEQLTTTCPNVYIRTVENFPEYNNPLDRI